MLSKNSVTSPRANRLARKRAICGSFSAASAGTQAVWPAPTTSTWPIADTSTPATVGLVPVR